MSSHRPLVRIFGAVVLMLALTAACGQRSSAGEKTKSAAAFEKMISLVGEWEGTNSTGQAKVTYTLVSGGTALMERLQSGSEPEMITLYSLDGGHLMMAHYCSAGNQPQMRTAAITELNGTLVFRVFQVMGMKSPDEDHMTGLTVTMPDHDHFTQEWTFLDKGKPQSNLFKFRRKS
jgi:hypothetical protein